MAEENPQSQKKPKQGTIIADECQVQAAVAKLAKDTVTANRLIRIGRTFAARMLGDIEQDLFQEVIERTLSGEHRWYLDTNPEFADYVMWRMRTIAQQWQKKGDRRAIYDEVKVRSAVSLGTSEIPFYQPTDFETKMDYPDPKAINVERSYMEKILLDQTLRKIRQELVDNKSASEIYELSLLGYEAQEIRHQLNLNETTYNSARTYIWRKLIKLGLS